MVGVDSSAILAKQIGHISNDALTSSGSLKKRMVYLRCRSGGMAIAILGSNMMSV